MNESRADSYLRKLEECRLEPLADPLINGIGAPNPSSAGFSTGEVVARALGWQQELAARVREYQEGPDIPFEQKTEAANSLVTLATEAVMTIQTLSHAFPDVFRAVASRKAAFPVNLPVLPEDRENTMHWLMESLCLGSEHELKLRGRKSFSRQTFANQTLLQYIGRIKATAIELQRLRIQYAISFESIEKFPEEKLIEAPLSRATVKEWMDAIWKLLLADYPEPEKHQRLRQFGVHKARKTLDIHGRALPATEAANIRAAIRDALLKYLLRMLPDK